MSVREHVELPLLIDECEPHVARRVAHKLLLACEIEDGAGLDPGDLSDGERLRVAIARALVIEPHLLLVDGAISGLSIIEQRSVMDLLSRLASDAKVAVLVADTGASEILRADPILYLRDGRLIGPDAGGEPGKLYRLPSAMPPHSSSAADA
jgi:ABC-type lipoprotein export system ATPase subunit